MYPFSYTGLKLIHEQNVQEALERQRLSAEQRTPGKGLRQAFRQVLTRFNRQPLSKRMEQTRTGSLM